MHEAVFALPTGRYHALEGEVRGGDRPLVFLHGFPDHPPTARALLGALTDRGHRVLAPWLPGYAPSPRIARYAVLSQSPRMARDAALPVAPSPRMARYDVLSLAAELRALIDHWSPDEPVDLVGHDWGAMLTYALCVAAPGRIRRAVTLAVPHPLTVAAQLRTFAQLRASWYMGVFQLPGSTRLVMRNDFALIDRLWRAWSPSFTLPTEDRIALHECLAASMPAPLDYYRHTRAAAIPLLRTFRTPIGTPLLALHGADDGCVLPPTRDDRHHFTGPYARETLAGLGHFLHLEAPAAIAARISSWLCDELSAS